MGNSYEKSVKPIVYLNDSLSIGSPDKTRGDVKIRRKIKCGILKNVLLAGGVATASPTRDSIPAGKPYYKLASPF